MPGSSATNAGRFRTRCERPSAANRRISASVGAGVHGQLRRSAGVRHTEHLAGEASEQTFLVAGAAAAAENQIERRAGLQVRGQRRGGAVDGDAVGLRHHEPHSVGAEADGFTQERHQTARTDGRDFQGHGADRLLAKPKRRLQSGTVGIGERQVRLHEPAVGDVHLRDVRRPGRYDDQHVQRPSHARRWHHGCTFAAGMVLPIEQE